MSYVVLARKWRPMVFDDVVAQSHVTTTLKNAITTERLASAYLFTGPRGVGKTTTARIFAKAINCETGPTPTPCNECTICKEINESRSLEVFEIDGASNRGIDEVRNLRENLKYAASKGKHKIYIIDEVHMLTTEAFNALLKTLEEPPPKVLFVFATTEPHKVPATILSRCQRYDFHRIPIQEIVEQLQKICKEEGIEIDEQSLYLLAKKSEGSLRDSQSLLDQVVSFCGEKISADELSELLGIIDQELFFEATDCIAQKNIPGVLQLVEKVFNHGYDMAEFLNGLTEHFRNILVIGATDDPAHLEGLETYAGRYREAGRAFSDTDILRLIQMASDTIFQIKQSSNPKLILEMLLIKMAKMDKSVDLDTILTTLSKGGKEETPSVSGGQGAASTTPPATTPNQSGAVKIKQIKSQLTQSTAAPTPVAESSPVAQSKENGANGNGANGHGETPSPAEQEIDSVVALERIKNEWTVIIDEVKAKKIHLGSFLNEGYPTALRNTALEISFGNENGFHVNMINQNKRLIQDVILAQTGFRISLQCRKNDSKEFQELLMQSKPETNIPETSSTDPEETSEEDMLQVPIVKKILEMFDGEIIKVNE